MEHLELHVLKSSHDVELAHIAGLLEDSDQLTMTCELCKGVVRFHQDVDLTPSGMIILSEDKLVQTCDSCLGFAIQAISM